MIVSRTVARYWPLRRIHRTFPQLHPPVQQGFAMVSAMVLLMVAAALLSLYVERMVEQGRLERGEQIGHALGVMGLAFEAYISGNYAQLASDQPSVSGVRDALEPTADELIRMINIKGVGTAPPALSGGSYRFKVSRPAGCVQKDLMSNVSCRLTGLAYLDRPILRGNQTDHVALSRAVRVMKGRGGYAPAENPMFFAFPNGSASSVPVPIPNPTRMAGVLAWRADTLPENTKYLKTSGANRMNGTLRLDGNGGPHDLQGARDVTAAGKFSGRSLEIAGNSVVRGDSNVVGNHSVNGNHIVFGNSKTRGNSVVDGWLQVKGEGLTSEDVLVNRNAKVRQDLTVKGSLAVRGEATLDSLRFSRSYNPGESCRQPGLVGLSYDEGLLFCARDRRWRLLGAT